MRAAMKTAPWLMILLLDDVAESEMVFHQLTVRSSFQWIDAALLEEFPLLVLAESIHSIKFQLPVELEVSHKLIWVLRLRKCILAFLLLLIGEDKVST